MKSLLRLALLALFCGAGSCESAPELSPESRHEMARLADLQLNQPSVPEPGLLCMGQFNEAQMESLVRLGYRSFINLRLPAEPGSGWEADQAGSLGVTYANLPIANANSITEENARRFAHLLEGAQGPTVVYCASSNRVGALYGAKSFFVDGKSAEESLQLGRQTGLTRLEPRLRALLGL